MTAGKSATALLLAAHGERRQGATNDGAARLAAALAARGVADEVGVGFIKGTPSITDAIRVFTARRIIVFPLFMADGYFTAIRLPELLDAAWQQDRSRILHVLPPLGLDPGFADWIAERAAAARPPGAACAELNLILLAHGSTTQAASGAATKRLAMQIGLRRRFRIVRCAFLDEAPSLREASFDLVGPLVVVGLFAGDGKHAAHDVPRLIAELNRSDVLLAETIGHHEGLERLIAGSVARAIEGERRRSHAKPCRGGLEPGRVIARDCPLPGG